MMTLTNLRCGYPGFTLEIPNLAIPSGQITCIIGPNGSGKSTLIRAINGGIALTGGSIHLDGRPLGTISLKERARLLATVSQQSEFPDLSVVDYVMLGRIPHQRPLQFQPSTTDLDAVNDAVRQTGIGALLERRLTELSGGERQLCLITKALVQEPKVLLLDEPNTYLDIGHQMQTLDLIQSLVAERGLTVIMVLHDLNLAGEYGHQLLLLQDGLPVRIGTPTEVLNFIDIEAAYGTPVIVSPSPLSGKPHIFMISAETLQRHQPR